MDSRSSQQDVMEPEQHHAPEITPPPQLEPASPRTALIMIGVVLLLLLAGAAITMLARCSGISMQTA